eukprot:8417487-Pyramimonas_sp.AAC.1
MHTFCAGRSLAHPICSRVLFRAPPSATKRSEALQSALERFPCASARSEALLCAAPEKRNSFICPFSGNAPCPRQGPPGASQ